MLGAGGFGVTYLAFDHQLDGPVALKEYFPADAARRGPGCGVAPSTTASRALFNWGLDRFIDEARSLHRLRHANVVRAHRYVQAHGTAYIVMEYVEGQSLQQVLRERGRLTPDAWRRWLDPLLDGLAHVHGHGYLHRDLKPANIMIRSADGTPVPIDFGAARMAAGDRTHTQVLTPGYAPLEQYSGESVQGPPTDIYALAAVSYHVLTEKRLSGAPDRVLDDDYEPLANRIGGANRRWLICHRPRTGVAAGESAPDGPRVDRRDARRSRRTSTERRCRVRPKQEGAPHAGGLRPAPDGEAQTRGQWPDITARAALDANTRAITMGWQRRRTAEPDGRQRDARAFEQETPADQATERLLRGHRIVHGFRRDGPCTGGGRSRIDRRRLRRYQKRGTSRSRHFWCYGTVGDTRSRQQQQDTPVAECRVDGDHPQRARFPNGIELRRRLRWEYPPRRPRLPACRCCARRRHSTKRPSRPCTSGRHTPTLLNGVAVDGDGELPVAVGRGARVRFRTTPSNDQRTP